MNVGVEHDAERKTTGWSTNNEQSETMAVAGEAGQRNVDDTVSEMLRIEGVTPLVDRPS